MLKWKLSSNYNNLNITESSYYSNNNNYANTDKYI